MQTKRRDYYNRPTSQSVVTYCFVSCFGVQILESADEDE